MQLEDSEDLLKVLFQKVLDRYRLQEVNGKGIVQALRAVMTTPELHRLFYVLSILPKEALKPLEEEILRDYRREVTERLQAEHLFLARGRELQVIRRPGILLTYTYMGKIYLAISERCLLSGEGGKLTLHELAEFQYLPRPNRATAVGAVARQWQVALSMIDWFLEECFYRVPHQEQVDIFFDDQLNLLRYDRQGRFQDALPPSNVIPVLSVVKRRTGPGPGPRENAGSRPERGHEEGDLACGSAPSYQSSSSSSA